MKNYLLILAFLLLICFLNKSYAYQEYPYVISDISIGNVNNIVYPVIGVSHNFSNNNSSRMVFWHYIWFKFPKGSLFSSILSLSAYYARSDIDISCNSLISISSFIIYMIFNGSHIAEVIVNSPQILTNPKLKMYFLNDVISWSLGLNTDYFLNLNNKFGPYIYSELYSGIGIRIFKKKHNGLRINAGICKPLLKGRLKNKHPFLYLNITYEKKQKIEVKNKLVPEIPRD